MAHNPQSEVAPKPQSHQYPTAQLSALSEATQDEDRYLVLRAQDGDIDAFEKLVERYQGRLFRSAYMIVRNRQDSEDIVQDTLVQAWRSLHLVREPAAFGLCRFALIKLLVWCVSASVVPRILMMQKDSKV